MKTQTSIASPVILAHSLTKRYGSLTAVKGIDFAIESQECFGFLGPNGAGKTTTMRMIYGFSPVTEGDLHVLRKDVQSEIRAIKQQIGVIPQEDNLDPDLKVLQNLLVYARYFDIPKKIARERAREALELLQLWERRDAFIRELSGGMKRRLIIARALINKPDLLIADEPTTGLDPQARHLVWQKLRQLKSRGVTLVLTTHYMEEAAQLCDRLAIMDEGKILDVGSPQELIEKHVRPEVFELQLSDGARDKLSSRLRELPVQVEEAGDTLYAYTNDGQKVRAELDMAAGIQRLVQRQATLEDVFLKLTGHALAE
jgi:lipooligosaccharide transport system ATP-binding protein